MSFNKKTVTKLLCTLVETLTGVAECVLAKGDVRIKGTYATVNLFTSNGIGWDEVNHADQADPDLDLDETIEGTRQLSFSFNFYRTNAYDLAEKFRTLLQGRISEEYLKANGLGLGTRGATRDIDEAIAKNYEERAQIDVDFFVVDLETLITRSIQSVEIEGTLESSGEQTNITIDVP